MKGHHHDVLVVQITIANIDIQRVLIDNESSTNIFFVYIECNAIRLIKD